jgi:hypothetical protein
MSATRESVGGFEENPRRGVIRWAAGKLAARRAKQPVAHAYVPTTPTPATAERAMPPQRLNFVDRIAFASRDPYMALRYHVANLRQRSTELSGQTFSQVGVPQARFKMPNGENKVEIRILALFGEPLEESLRDLLADVYTHGAYAGEGQLTKRELRRVDGVLRKYPDAYVGSKVEVWPKDARAPAIVYNCAPYDQSTETQSIATVPGVPSLEAIVLELESQAALPTEQA